MSLPTCKYVKMYCVLASVGSVEENAFYMNTGKVIAFTCFYRDVFEIRRNKHIKPCLFVMYYMFLFAVFIVNKLIWKTLLIHQNRDWNIILTRSLLGIPLGFSLIMYKLWNPENLKWKHKTTQIMNRNRKSFFFTASE